MICSKINSQIRYEFNSIFSLKILPIFILFFIASLFLVNSGIAAYKNVLKDLDTVFDNEEQLKNFHITYEQYGAFGLNIFFKPSPLVVFFHNSSLIKELESSFNTFEILKIYLNAKGKEILKKSSGFKDFSGILNVFGSLLMTI